MKLFLRNTMLAMLLCAVSMVSNASLNQSHFLIGVDGGYAVRDGDITIDIYHPTTRTTFIDNHNNNGFIFGFLGGYEAYFQEFLVGLELNLGFQDFSNTRYFQFFDVQGRSYDANARHKRRAVFGVTARGGYRLAPWIIAYVRAGAETSSEKIHVQAVSSTLAVSMDDNRRAVRFIGGMGFEFPVTCNSNVRLEYNYSTRGRGAAASQVASDGATVFDALIKPSQHAIKLAYVLNFDFSYFRRDDA